MTQATANRLPLTAVILAGGKSTRMGTDKALLRLGESTLLERSCALVTPLFDQTLIIAASAEQCAQLDLAGATILQDDPDFRGRGPLAGIYTGLCHARNEAACVLTCDMPFVDVTILHYLTSHSNASHDVTCFKNATAHHEPFPGIFHVRLLPSLNNNLKANKLSLCRYLEHSNVQYLPIPHARESAFTNTNTPQEFQSAVSLRAPNGDARA